MLFDKFNDEAEFRAAFVRPLLTRLGFVSVAELHGQQEYGKDFVFSELTPFGFLRHYAAVVKHEKQISQTSLAACNAILAQVRQAFSVSFRLPDSEAAHRVGSVIVFNSGRMTDNARNWIRSEIDEERYGRNVHVLDGERLFQLDLTSTFRQGEQLLPRLQGMRNDCSLNLIVWASILETLPRFAEARGSFTSALEDFIAAPFLTNKLDLNDISTLVQECRIIDQINFRYMTPNRQKQEQRDQEAETIKRVISKATVRAIRLIACINATMSSFRLLTNPER
ncbi:MAG: hypothetical protein HQ567_23485 [Candidatus Nealsonbacteria bacterium]|nr:hypothetical protein [Candidatus Nealsonbacteria bacterium]